MDPYPKIYEYFVNLSIEVNPLDELEKKNVKRKHKGKLTQLPCTHTISLIGMKLYKTGFTWERAALVQVKVLTRVHTAKFKGISRHSQLTMLVMFAGEILKPYA